MPEKGSKKTWEKERRDRLKEAFTNLEKVLPSYDPSSTSTRLSVLNKSIEYIQEMQNKIQELLKPTTKVNSDVLQLKKLQDRIKRLLNRIELLSGLLREARISIPNQGSSLKYFKYGYKWSGKINEKTASILQKKAEQKENEKENKKLSEDDSGQQIPKKRIKNKFKSSSSTPKHRKNRPLKNPILPKRKILETPTSNCFIIYTQASNTQSCYLVTNAPSSNFGNVPQTVITNSLVASNPLMCANIKPNKKSVTEASPTLPTLNAGTMILANGTLYPVLPQTQSIIPAPMVLQVANNPMVIKSQPIENLKIISEVGRKSKMASKSATKNDKEVSCSSTLNKDVLVKTTISTVETAKLTKITSIRPNICFTKTTHVNKLPIPALPSNFLIKPVSETKKVTKNRRIDSKPMSRAAFRRIRKLALKRSLEEKIESAKKMKTKELNEEKQKDGENSTKIVDNNQIVNVKQNISIISNNVIVNGGNNSENTQHKNDTQIEINKSLEDNSLKQHENKQINNEISCSFQNDMQQIQNTNFLNLNLKNSPKIVQNSENMENRSANSQNMCNLKPPQNVSTQNMCNMAQHVENLEDNRNMSNQNVHGKNIETNISSQNMCNMNQQSLNNSSQTLCNMNQNVNEVHSSSQNMCNMNQQMKSMEDGNISSQNLCQQMKNLENLDDSRNISSQNLCNMNQQIKNLDLNFGHSELSNDIFASLQVPTGCQNPDSTSPTAAFLLAFPLVSSMTGVKTTEVLDEENPDSQTETPTILQIGTMDANKPTHDSLTTNLLNLDNLSFLSSKDIYSGLYTSFEQHLNSLTSSTNNFIPDLPKFTQSLAKNDKLEKNETKIDGNSYNIDNITGLSNNDYRIFEEKLAKKDLQIKTNEKDSLKQSINYFGSDNKTVENSMKFLNPFSVENQSVSKKSDNCVKTIEVNTVPTSNLFHYDNRNNQKIIENNLNFLNDKSKTENNMQFLQKNIMEHNCQLPFIENKNFVPISQTNFSHNLFNIDNNFPSFMQKNTNYKTPNFAENAQKDANETNKIDLLQKTCNFNDNKNNITDFSFNFTLGNKTQKVEENKQPLPSYNMTYTSINYDLNNFTKVCTCSFVSNKTFPDPLYTNSNNNSYNYYSTSENYLNDNCFKNIKNDKNVDFENYNSECRIFPENFQKNLPISTRSDVQKPTYNWMTTPAKTSIDHILPQDVFSNQFFNTTIFPSDITQTKNFQKNDEENQFTWSPTKIPQFLEPVPNFVSSTLPTLVGDLALNFNEQKVEKNSIKKNVKLNCENQNNFLSVSQLVTKDVQTKSVRRRNSATCNKTNQKIKKTKINEDQNKTNQNKPNEKTITRFCETNNKRNATKISSTNYSAEALISSESGTKKNTNLPSFMPENMLFPSIETSENFTHFSTFPNNFIPSIASSEDFDINLITNAGNKKLKNFKEQKVSPSKKMKKKPTNDVTQNFVDYSFLTVPGSVNSPISEEFHTNFLPPPPPPPPTQSQLFPCKNSSYVLYCNIASTAPLLPLPPIPTVTRARIQHPEISPSLNTAGTSLANFNLSTIFPEINKGSMGELYTNNDRAKDQQVSKYSGNNANSKPTFSYSNCQNSQNFGIDNNNR